MSTVTRRAVYFRLTRDDHVAHRRESIRDPWRDFDGVRAVAASLPAGVLRRRGLITDD